MKKILIQSHDFYPKTSPAAKRIYSFVDFLTKEGWEVHLFSMVEKKYLPQLKRKFPNLTIFSLSEKFRTWNNKLQRLLRNWYFYKNTIKLFKENNIIDYDYALATSPEILPCLAMLKISKAFRIKLILDVRDIWPDVLNEMKL